MSTRMGRAKEWLTLGSETLLGRVVRVVSEAARPVVVAGRRGQILPALPADVEVVHDEQEGVGPLAGLAAGFAALRERCQAVVVATCDHPFLRAAVVERLIFSLQDRRAVVVGHEGETYPLLGVYRTESLSRLGDCIAEGERRGRRFAEACEAVVIDAETLRDVDPCLQSLLNVNDASGYEAALALLRAGGEDV